MSRQKHSVSLDKKDKDRIEKLSKRYRLSMGEITGYLYEMCERYDMMRVGWESRMETADQERAAKANDCPNFILRETWYICLQPREGKSPKITKLSRKLDEALEMCDSCKTWRKGEEQKRYDRSNALRLARARR